MHTVWRVHKIATLQLTGFVPWYQDVQKWSLVFPVPFGVVKNCLVSRTMDAETQVCAATQPRLAYLEHCLAYLRVVDEAVPPRLLMLRAFHHKHPSDLFIRMLRVDSALYTLANLVRIVMDVKVKPATSRHCGTLVMKSAVGFPPPPLPFCLKSIALLGLGFRALFWYMPDASLQSGRCLVAKLTRDVSLCSRIPCLSGRSRPWLTMTMTMTMDKYTLREVPHTSMRAWPYRQERRGHGPTKKSLSYR